MGKAAVQEPARQQTAAAVEAKRIPWPAASSGSRHAEVLRVQQAAGNRATAGLLRTANHTAAESLAVIVRAALRGGGRRPLDPQTRLFMESRFGYDFGDVRLHTGALAASSAAALNARAYTVGRDVVFGEGEYAVQNAAGRLLLAHELAHVIQQSRGGTSPPSLRSGNALERSAEMASQAALHGGGVVKVGGSSAPGLARQPKSLTQSWDPAHWSDAELETEIRELRDYLTQSGPSPEGNELRFTLAHLETELLRRWSARGPAPQPARTAEEARKIEIARQQLERDLALAKRSPGLLAALLPTHVEPYFRESAGEIRHPLLRFAASTGTRAGFASARFHRNLTAIAAGVTSALVMSLALTPLAVKAGAAAGTAGLSFYLLHPILVNEIGLLTAGTIIAVEGDVLGLLRALGDRPEEAMYLFGQVWTIRASVGPPTGPARPMDFRARPLPPPQQTDSRQFRLRLVAPPAAGKGGAEPRPSPLRGSRPGYGSQRESVRADLELAEGGRRGRRPSGALPEDQRALVEELRAQKPEYSEGFAIQATRTGKAVKPPGKMGKGPDVVLQDGGLREVFEVKELKSWQDLYSKIANKPQRSETRELYIVVQRSSLTRGALRREASRVARSGDVHFEGKIIRIFDHNGRLLWEGKGRGLTRTPESKD